MIQLYARHFIRHAELKVNYELSLPGQLLLQTTYKIPYKHYLIILRNVKRINYADNCLPYLNNVLPDENAYPLFLFF